MNDKPDEKTQSALGHSSAESECNLNLVNLSKDTVRIEGYDATHNKLGNGYQSTGTIVSGDGLVLTADHGLTNSGVDRFDVQLSNGDHRAAVLVDRNEKLGLAAFRIKNDADELSPQYYPLKFSDDVKAPEFKETVTYGYIDHSLQPAQFEGLVGQSKMFNNISESVLQSSAPNIDRFMMGTDVHMVTIQGISGALSADSSTGAVLGMVQFSLGNPLPMTYVKAKASDESLLTPSNKLKNYLDSLINKNADDAISRNTPDFNDNKKS